MWVVLVTLNIIFFLYCCDTYSVKFTENYINQADFFFFFFFGGGVGRGGWLQVKGGDSEASIGIDT